MIRKCQSNSLVGPKSRGVSCDMATLATWLLPILFVMLHSDLGSSQARAQILHLTVSPLGRVRNSLSKANHCNVWLPTSLCSCPGLISSFSSLCLRGPCMAPGPGGITDEWGMNVQLLNFYGKYIFEALLNVEGQCGFVLNNRTERLWE